MPAESAPPRTQAPKSPGSDPIAHIVLIVQENRTFNNFFATFPNAAGSTTGLERIGTGKNAKTIRIALKETGLVDAQSLNHLYVSFMTAYRGGHMDAFNRITFEITGKPEKTLPYQYVDPSDIVPYWTLASDYGLADHMFQTQGSGSFTAHQDLIRGGTEITPTASIIDDPSSGAAWGCKSPYGTVTSLITIKHKFRSGAGPYPCTNHFPSSAAYETLADLLDAKQISWKYYTPGPIKDSVGALWNAFLVIDSLYSNKSAWETHISIPQTNIFNDITNGSLPAMSWVIPDAKESDHPGYGHGSDEGPSWVASIVNALGSSPYWNSTAVIVVWDDWGGFYDPVVPPKNDTQGGPGFRVGMIVASPYVAPNTVSHTVYGFGSVVRFIEDTWSLGRLGTTDVTSTSIADMFDFDRSPSEFKAIRAKYSQWFFLHQKPSGLPVDNE